MENEQILTLHKNGWYYCKQGEYGPWKRDTTRINGDPPEWLPHGDWCKLKAKPTLLEFLVTPLAERKHWVLKSEHADLNLPKTVPADHFGVQRWFDSPEERPNADTYSLYEVVHKKKRSRWEKQDRTFDIVDMDCEPVQMVLPVTIDFPASVEAYPECHHKYPCRVSGDTVFDLLHDRLAPIVAQAETLSMDDYKNIRTLTVSKELRLPTAVTRKVDVSRFGARRAKYRDKTFTKTTVTVMSWRGPSYRSESGTAVVPNFRADHYVQAVEKVEVWIAEQTAKLDDTLAQICPKCKGSGLVVPSKQP